MILTDQDRKLNAPQITQLSELWEKCIKFFYIFPIVNYMKYIWDRRMGCPNVYKCRVINYYNLSYKNMHKYAFPYNISYYSIFHIVLNTINTIFHIVFP